MSAAERIAQREHVVPMEEIREACSVLVGLSCRRAGWASHELHAEQVGEVGAVFGILLCDAVNNIAENSMSRVASGRKKAPALGSEVAGSTMAAILSVESPRPLRMLERRRAPWTIV